MNNVVVTRTIQDLFSINNIFDILSKVIRKLCLPIRITRYGIHTIIFVLSILCQNGKLVVSEKLR